MQFHSSEHPVRRSLGLSIKLLLIASLATATATACVQAQRVDLDGSKTGALLLPFLVNASLRAQFVAVGAGCSSSITLDGSTWTASTTRFSSCTTGAIKDVAYSNNLYVAVGELSSGSGCGLWTSADGITWTQKACSTYPRPLYSVAMDTTGTKIMAGGDSGGGSNVSYVYSVDAGVTWATNTITLASTGTADSIVYATNTSEFLIKMLAPGPSTQVRAASNPAAAPGTFATRGAGTMGAANLKFAKADGNFITGIGQDGSNNSVLSFSADAGSTWTKHDSTGTTDSLGHGASYITGFVFGDNRFVATLSDAWCFNIATSSGYQNWDLVYAARTGCSAFMNTAAYNSTLDIFYMGGSTGQLAKSSTANLTDWTYMSSGSAQAINRIASR